MSMPTTQVDIYVSGEIATEEALQDVGTAIQKLMTHCGHHDDHGHGQLVAAIRDGKPLHLNFDDVPYGDVPRWLVNACRKHGLAYIRKGYGDGQELAAETEVLSPAYGAINFIRDEDGNPLLSTADLQRALDAGQSLADLLFLVNLCKDLSERAETMKMTASDDVHHALASENCPNP